MSKRNLLVVGFAFWMVSAALAADVSVSDKTFGCIRAWPRVRNTRINHADSQRLAEAMRIFRDSVPNSFDFVCEKGHGCAPIPFNDQTINALQQADARCAKK